MSTFPLMNDGLGVPFVGRSLSRDERLRIACLIGSRLTEDFPEPDRLLYLVSHAPLRDPSAGARAMTYAEHCLRVEDRVLPEVLRANPHLVEERFFRDQAFLKSMAADAERQIFLCAFAYWVQSGFAQIEMGHKYAAALIMTNVSREIAEEVQMPFKAFAIEIPNGLLAVQDRDGSLRAITRVTVTRMPNAIAGEKAWAYTAETDSSLTFWRFGATIDDLLHEKHFPVHASADPLFNPLAVTITDSDERVALCLGRLIINTCLAMADPSNFKEVGPGHRIYAQAQKGGSSKTNHLPPVVRTFRVGKPVAHDFRDAISDFVAGRRERQGLDCQITVVGHYKRQVFGAGRKERKIIWIEPYRRGPEGAPILVRPHVLGKNQSEGDSK